MQSTDNTQRRGGVEHLNQAQLARRWKISQRTLERWRWHGVGPPFIKIGGRVVYRLEDIETFEAQQRRSSTSEKPEPVRRLGTSGRLQATKPTLTKPRLVLHSEF